MNKIEALKAWIESYEKLQYYDPEKIAEAKELIKELEIKE